MNKNFDYDHFQECLYCYAPSTVRIFKTKEAESVDPYRIQQIVVQYNKYNKNASKAVIGEQADNQCRIINSKAVFSPVQRLCIYSGRLVYIYENHPLYGKKTALEIG